MRFRQSYAKILASSCPAVLRDYLDNGRKMSPAMRDGQLLDCLVFGLHDKYEVVEASYKSGPRKGEPCQDWTASAAQEARKEAEEQGLIAVLPCELDVLAAEVEALKARLAAFVEDGTVITQPHVMWESQVPCEGTPDIIVIHGHGYSVVDLKSTCPNPRKLARQAYEMGWDIQAAAYQEAAAEHIRELLGVDEAPPYRGHWLLVSSNAEKVPPIMRRLSDVYFEVGRRRWLEAQHVWEECQASGEWPGYDEWADVMPPIHAIRQEIESSDVEVEP